MDTSPIRSIKGVKDILPPEMPRWRFIEETARRLAEVYGFSEIRVPIFEVTDLFARSIGASTDIVEKEMYTFPDRDGKLLTLRPEATAGVVRAYIEHNLAHTSALQKFFYLGPMFRHERPQAGRLRQFHQFGVESFGSHSPLADVEVIALLWEFLRALQLPDLLLEVNTLGDPGDRAAYRAVLGEFLQQRADKLCDNCRRRMIANPLRVLDCKVPECRPVLAEAPLISEHLASDSRRQFEEVLRELEALQIPHSVNPRLVRGLDYYTFTTFEVSSRHLGAQNAVGAGGRYDGLVEALGGPPTPAVGFAAGLERIALLLPEPVLPGKPPALFMAAFGRGGVALGVQLAAALRREGVPTELDHRATSLKNLLRQADRLGASYALILGDDEAARKEILLRNMKTKEQESLPLDEAIRVLLTRFKTS
jgi:histidyl-tRNA synthetase